MPEPISELKFEEALKRLEEIVSLLESGKADLDSSLSAYEEGVALLRVCHSKLSDAEQKIELLKRIDPETGTAETVPIDPEMFRADETTAGRQTSASGRKKRTM